MWHTIRRLSDHQHAIAAHPAAEKIERVSHVHDRTMQLAAAVTATLQQAGTWEDDVTNALCATAVEALVALELVAGPYGAHAALHAYLERAERALPITEPRTLQEAHACPASSTS